MIKPSPGSDDAIMQNLKLIADGVLTICAQSSRVAAVLAIACRLVSGVCGIGPS
jgi:hypothetical protein